MPAFKSHDQRRYNTAYYRKHREAEITRVIQRQRSTLALLRDLRRVPCADCRGTFPPYAMDFDHREPSEKSFGLTFTESLLRNRDLLLAEVAKCDIVCANCHRIRTAAAVASGKLRPSRFPRRTEEAATPRLQRGRNAWHRRKTSQMQIVREQRQRPCFDCGGAFPIEVMEFDHRQPAEKRYLVSQMAGRVKLATLLDEIAKCDIVCTNCHRVRTYRRRVIEHTKQLQLLEEPTLYVTTAALYKAG